jgi:hypothetical protein
MNKNYLLLNVFKFERRHLGNKTITVSGEKYGPYLYRNMDNNNLISSWDKPIYNKNYLYKGEDIGYNTDALLYYKNK